MAFGGTAVLKKVTDKLFRLTGVTLAADASGTIGFSDKTSAAEVSLVAPDWQPYQHAEPGQAAAGVVSLQDAINVRTAPTTDVTAAVPISIVKTGTTHLDFVITLHNDTAGTLSGVLEIYIEFGGH